MQTAPTTIRHSGGFPAFMSKLQATEEAEMGDKEETHIERRLREIKAEMGQKLICHPAYQFNPRHSNDPKIYMPARAPYELAIAMAAKADRDTNPLYVRSQAFITALETLQ